MGLKQYWHQATECSSALSFLQAPVVSHPAAAGSRCPSSTHVNTKATDPRTFRWEMRGATVHRKLPREMVGGERDTTREEKVLKKKEYLILSEGKVKLFCELECDLSLVRVLASL